jgi:hypothetical protein
MAKNETSDPADYGTASRAFYEQEEPEPDFEEPPDMDEDIEQGLIEAYEQGQLQAQDQFAAHAAIYNRPRKRTCEQCQEQPATKFHDESALSLCDECFSEVSGEEERL